MDIVNGSLIKEKILELKSRSGTHSPSIDTLKSNLPELKIEVDACFLSNPYATELFLKYLDKELVQTGGLRDVLEFYPPQNREVAHDISKAIGVADKNIFVGNGAIEIIQSILHNFTSESICVTLPTFSSYYEFVKDDTNVIYYHLDKNKNYELDPEEYVCFVKKHKPNTIVIINPNNPNGAYLKTDEISYILENLSFVENIILDESFIHFAFEDAGLKQISSERLVNQYDNLIVVKSMSKDFGIAGIRAGYGVMTTEKVNSLLKNGFLWNVSGLASFFFKIYSQPDFIADYEMTRKKYIMNTQFFLQEISKLEFLKVYPSKANFALVELLSDKSSTEVALDLLCDYGVYVRDCSDKIGLDGSFLRVASRTFEENEQIIRALSKL